MSTIKDVARAAGVSVSTVSNVINNKSSVRLDIYNRVQHVIKELNYQPNMLARNLRSNKLNTIALIFWRMEGYTGGLLESMLYHLGKQNYQCIVQVSYESGRELMETVNEFIGMGVGGIILCSPFIDEKTLRGIPTQVVPIMLMDYCVYLPGFMTMELDNADVVADLTRTLCQDGPCPGIMTLKRSFACESSSYQGYARALSDMGLAPNPDHALELPPQRNQLYEALLQQIPEADESLPTRWIVSNEIIAGFAADVMRIRGIRDFKIYVLSSNRGLESPYCSIIRIERDVSRYIRNTVDAFVMRIRRQIICDEGGRVSATADWTADRGVVDRRPQRPPRANRLRVLLPDVPMSKSIQLLISEFTSQTGIAVDITLKNMTELLDEIIHSCDDPKHSYDVVAYHINWLKYLGGHGYLRPLEAHLDYDAISSEYVPSVQKLLKTRDYHNCGLAAEMGLQILAFREDLFSSPIVQKNFYDKMGLELHPPRSWSEFNLIARFFTRSFNPSSPTEYGTCIAGHVPIGLIEEFWPRCRTFMGQLHIGSKSEIASKANIRALENLCESYACSYPKCENYMDLEQVDQMLKSEIAMVVTYLNYVLLDSRMKEKHIGFCASPSNMTVIDSYLLGIPQSSESPEPAADFIRWCCSDEIAHRSILLGRIVPKKKVILDSSFERYSGDIVGAFEGVESAIFREDVFGDRLDKDAERIIANELARAVYGGVRPESVLRDLQKRLCGD